MSLQSFHDFTTMVTHIDRRKCKREVPIRVLILGMSRTGTVSLGRALKLLGYNDVYHGLTSTFGNPKDYEMWWEACRAKFDGVGKPYTREDWDQLLGHCQAVSDFPAIAFAEELIAAYPEAKIILTIRDVETWYRSMSQTIQPLHETPFIPWRFFILLSQLLRIEYKYVLPVWHKIFHHTFRGSFTRNGREVYIQHYENIRNLVPSERLLEFDVREGWGPVCKFLECGIPDTEFPRENNVESFRGKIRALVLRKLGDGVWNVVRLGMFAAGCLWVGERVWESLKGFVWGQGVVNQRALWSKIS